MSGVNLLLIDNLTIQVQTGFRCINNEQYIIPELWVIDYASTFYDTNEYEHDWISSRGNLNVQTFSSWGNCGEIPWRILGIISDKNTYLQLIIWEPIWYIPVTKNNNKLLLLKMYRQ